jgi:subfamily B ATP-binding cassette protein MsbA
MRTYLRLLRYVRPYAGRLGVALACMALFAATNFVSLGMISPLMSVLFRSAGGGAAVAVSAPPTAALAVPGVRLPQAVSELGERWIVRAQPLVALERICVILLVIFVLKNLADYLQAFLMVSIEQGVIRDLRSALYAHLQRLSLSFYHGKRSGMLVSRVTNDMEYLRAALASSISNLVKHGLTLLGALVWVFVTSWQLALLSLLVVPPLGVTLAAVGRKMRKRSGRAQERMADMTAILQELSLIHI